MLTKLRIDFFKVPPAALNALRKDLAIYETSEGAIEIHVHDRHVLSWTAETGWHEPKDPAP